MNQIIIDNVRSEAKRRSEMIKGTMVYALCKNGACTAIVTADEDVKNIYVHHNFSVWGTYLNGVKIKTES